MRSTRRRLLLWVGAGLVLLALAFTALSGFYLDILWFREVRFSSVFWTIFWARILPALAFGAVFFVLLYANLLVVRAIRPRYRVYAPGEEVIERYRTGIEPYVRWILPGIALVFAIFAATGIATRWEEFQLWRASGGVTFGIEDPVFGRDVSFYVLRLPFLRFIQSWLFSSLVTVTVLTAAAHYLWGGIRPRAVGERVTPQVKAHLSVLLGLIVLVKAWGYRLGQFDLLVSPRGTVTGASYTDVNAHLPALRVLVIIAILCAVLFLLNIRFRGWALPVIGLAILALFSIGGGAAWPAIVQRFQVAPQELDRERPFITRNIEFTRRAFGIDQVEERRFAAEPQVSQEEIEAGRATVENIRLWNPDVLRTAYQQLQRIRPYYEFVDVDVDRYEIEGARRVVMIAPREISQDGIPGGGGTWQNRHLFYTHGYGAAAARVDEITTEGQPVFALSEIPVEGSLDIQEPRIYFGEDADVPFTVVRTNTPEFDYPQSAEGESEFARTQYEGDGGIPAGGFLRRLAFAWRYRDVNLLISGLIEPESRILINTRLSERVQKVAPFLRYDHDPYAAIVEGRIVWIWDAYTTSDRYPYSQRVELAELSGGALDGRANYIRNSVKVVVDAYDGSMTFYRTDDDPMIAAWARVFPDLFTPMSEAPAELREHFRYPEDLFRVQAHQYANYHVTDPNQFFAKEDFWSVPRVAQGAALEGAATTQPPELEPYYVLVPLPGEDEERFVLFSPFTPANRPNMISWMGAISDPEQYGDLISFEFPSGRNVSGPGQVAGYISQDPDVAREVSLLDQRGSRVIYGDLLAIPIGQSFLYVQPLYLQAEQQSSAIPELKRVIVVRGNAVTMAATLDQAITQTFSPSETPTEPGPEPTEPGDPEPTPTPEPAPTGNLAELLRQASEHFARAEELLRAGDLAGYQREIEAAERAVSAAIELTAPQG
ncbi:MAG TPA: UPF0182 family protein [Actinomycetota bacterium]|nr:UPF0182 family protein [Actinomycetota bacterium]